MKSVLLVDDNRDLCDSMLEIFADLGSTNCKSATSLAELQTFENNLSEFDITLLDINLGANVPSGIDAYYWLKKVGYKGEIIFFTGHASSHPLVKEALGIPNVKLLEKPASLEEIEALIQ